MKDILDTIYKLAKLWLGDPRSRVAKLLIVAGIALIAAPWWQPIVQNLAVRHLNIDESFLANTDRTMFVSGWCLVIGGIALYAYLKRIPDTVAAKIDVTAHWWTGCLDDGVSENPDLFMTVKNNSSIDLPWLNVHVFPSNTYQLEPTTEKMTRLMSGQYAMYRFPVVDGDGNLTNDAQRFHAVARDELSIRIFKTQSADDPVVISFPLGAELHDHIALYTDDAA